MESYLFFYLTNIVIIANLLLDKRWLRFFLLYIIIGGNFIYFCKRKQFLISLKKNYGLNETMSDIGNILFHIIIPLYLFSFVKGRLTLNDWFNGIKLIVLYGIIINTKAYYYTQRDKFILCGFIMWTIISIIFNNFKL